MSVNTPQHPTRTPPGSIACRKKTGNSPSSVVLPIELQAAVIDVAKKEDRSFSAVVRRAVAAYVARHSAA